MKWRKWNRWIHRELGFLFFGMSIIYGISGIALNHYVARHWDPGIISKSESFTYTSGLLKSQISKETVQEILTLTGESSRFKQYYFPDPDHLMIYLRGGHILFTLSTGEGVVTLVRNRPFFREMNYLHYNKPKKLWTWFSDLFAFALILLAISGLFLVKGKKGITGRGAILTVIGIVIPLLFLVYYLWY